MAAKMTQYLLAVDQGTSSARAHIFDASGKVCARAQLPLQQFFPASGWVEHDAMEILQLTLQTIRQALDKAKLTARDIAALGMTNQRETVVLWDKSNGEPIHRAIVWQDRRTAQRCQTLKAQVNEADIKARTGLLLDPYFSATKIQWLLEEVPLAQQLHQQGRLACGTIDSFLLWHLTDGKLHATDATNASRTLLFNISTQKWDPTLLDLFAVPLDILPMVKDTVDDYGCVSAKYFDHEIPIRALVGDQQAALVGQACLQPGMVKATFGSGSFIVRNMGSALCQPKQRLLATVAYRINGVTTYALEGSSFNAGTAVQWLKEGLGIIDDAAEINALVKQVPDNGGVTVIPAFTGPPFSRDVKCESHYGPS